MPSLALTDRFCASAKVSVPNQAQTDFYDSHATGLGLRVASSGRKSWVFLFTSPKTAKRARMTLGTYPATSLSDARERAKKARGDVEAGLDPRDVAADQEAGAMTMKALIASYLSKHAKVNLRTADAVERRLNKNVRPVIGDVKLADVHKRDINRVIDPILKREALVEASRVFEDVRAMLRWAVARGDMDHSPMEGMTKPTKANVRERTLSDEEIRTMWNVLPTALARSKSAQRILKLCLLTGQRVGEVAGMAASELDLRTGMWSLPGSRTKNGHPHNVPLSSQAVDIIQDAFAGAGSGARFVFPSGGGSLPAGAIATTLRRAQVRTERFPMGRFGFPDWTAHDLRRTALTGMASLGVQPIVLGHVANHLTTTKAGITLAVYSKHQYDREKREALELWAERVAAIVSGAESRVVALHAAKSAR